MRKTLLSFALLAACGALPAGAQEPAELFDKLDTNKDGVISADEVPDDKQTTFERLVKLGDGNGDKKLSKDELIAGLKKLQSGDAPAEGDRPGARPGAPGDARVPVGRFAEQMFDRADANSDGKLTKDEFPEERREMFSRVAQAAGATGDSLTKEQFIKGMTAMAQNAGGGRPGAGQPEGRPGAGVPVPGGPVLRALDANNDGELSASEIADAAKALAKLDRNGDGKLTRDEIGPPMGAGGDRPGARPEGRPEGRPAAGGGALAEEFLKRLQAADANGDKKISKEEAPDRLKENFDRADRNGDGQLDEGELKEVFNRLREAGGEQPRRRPNAEPKKE